MKTQFNTGRFYQADGQRIVCETVDDGERHGIIFNDLSRGIDGYIPLAKLPPDRYCLETQTLHNYDFGNYQWDPVMSMAGFQRARDLKWE
jgi:hypothetical protein